MTTASKHPLEERLNYQFRNPALLQQALTHPSKALTKDGSPYNNQRLEFLGDAVLGVLIAHMLYHLYPSEPEGDLSRRLVGLVNGEMVTQVASQLNLGEYLVISASDVDAGGRSLSSNLEDACEALIGAIFLDGGLEALQPIIETYWKPLALQNRIPPKDPKTALQEWAQARSLPLPQYQVISETGPSHAPQFTIVVSVEGGMQAEASAGAKKLAERLAAEQLLEQLQTKG